MTNIINIKAPSALSLSKQNTIKFLLYKLHSTTGIQKHSNCHELDTNVDAKWKTQFVTQGLKQHKYLQDKGRNSAKYSKHCNEKKIQTNISKVTIHIIKFIQTHGEATTYVRAESN